ncbi:unnamed protein product [Didymodactylos carnosus]|uniref:Uncharacterized protein n=3 Tax=Didymodactylos carnosus TaxID=1234261 RepID=A0A813U9K3_9BILA|nr:unnamed protein product [Didymodactylos carnosus]CAF3609359.1 unnamed protein product [Didymodactylos carnosus]
MSNALVESQTAQYETQSNDDENISSDQQGRQLAQLYRSFLTRASVFLTEGDAQSTTASVETSRPDTALSGYSLSSIRSAARPSSAKQSYRSKSASTPAKRNDKRHRTFQKFIDNLEDKRCSSIRRYQQELRDYLLKRLECDRIQEEVEILNEKVRKLQVEKNLYTKVFRLVQDALSLFPTGSLQGSEGVKGLILRYQTLSETKAMFQQRDLSKDKQERRQELSRLMLEHNTRIAGLTTRIAQLNEKKIELAKKESIKEDKLLQKVDLYRYKMATESQLLRCIDSLYDKYRLNYQPTGDENSLSTEQKLRAIQEFILYRIDLVERVNNMDKIPTI